MATPPVREVFHNALDCSSEEERQAYLDRACAGAPELRQQVEKLLRAHAKPVGVLDKAAPDLLASEPNEDRTADHVPAAETPSDPNRTTPADSKRFLEQRAKGKEPSGEERIGEMVGGYELVRKLGAGGMGVVYLGEKRDGKEVHRVAIKLIKPDRVNPHLVARFKAERRILTRLNHGNIAKVFDMGVHVAAKLVDDGEPALQEPYFIMEYVADQTLDKYCSDHRASIRDRLTLFEGICRGVEHAHSSNVIHRDLKGGNILVAAPKNSPPVPKVIDFGLAKALEEEPDAELGLTSPGSFMGTPEYMSPEQASGDAGIGPRTDVYALGVILYRLLTGTVPIELVGLRNQRDILNAIHEKVPALPSVKVVERKEKQAKVAEERQTEPAKLQSLLRGDLDWVVQKSLEKDPGSRYATAGAMADEVRRYLNGEPVEAGPTGRWPRAKKFVRRNRALVTAGSVVFVTLVLGVAGLVFGYVEVSSAKDKETAARERAEVSEDDTRKALFISLGPIREQAKSGEQLSEDRKESLRRTFIAVRQLVRETPDASARIRQMRAETSFQLATLATILGYQEARGLYDETIRRYESLNADFPKTAEYVNELARCHFDRAHFQQNRGYIDEAVADFRSAIKLHSEVVAMAPDESAYHRELANALNDFGVLLFVGGKLKEAETEQRSAVKEGEKAASLDKSLASYQIGLAMSYHNLGNCVRDQGKPKESVEFYSKAVDLLRPLALGLPEGGKSKEAAKVLVETLWDRANAKGWQKLYDDAFADWSRAWQLNEAFKFYTGGELIKFRAAAGLEQKYQGRIPDDEAYSAAKVNAQAFAAAKDEKTLQQQYQERVFELLNQAKTAGWFRDPKNVAAFGADADFKGLPKERIAEIVANTPPPKK